MSKLIGDVKPSPEALQQMRERTQPGQRFAAYQNMALDSASVGDLRFLKIGAGCTFTEAPAKYPDTQFGIGWRYLHCGFVNLETGESIDAAQRSCDEVRNIGRNLAKGRGPHGGAHGKADSSRLIRP